MPRLFPCLATGQRRAPPSGLAVTAKAPRPGAGRATSPAGSPPVVVADPLLRRSRDVIPRTSARSKADPVYESGQSCRLTLRHCRRPAHVNRGKPPRGSRGSSGRCRTNSFRDRRMARESALDQPGEHHDQDPATCDRVDPPPPRPPLPWRRRPFAVLHHIRATRRLVPPGGPGMRRTPGPTRASVRRPTPVALGEDQQSSPCRRVVTGSALPGHSAWSLECADGRVAPPAAPAQGVRGRRRSSPKP